MRINGRSDAAVAPDRTQTRPRRIPRPIYISALLNIKCISHGTTDAALLRHAGGRVALRTRRSAAGDHPAAAVAGDPRAGTGARRHAVRAHASAGGAD